jgi:hypothetical protein
MQMKKERRRSDALVWLSAEPGQFVLSRTCSWLSSNSNAARSSLSKTHMQHGRLPRPRYRSHRRSQRLDHLPVRIGRLLRSPKGYLIQQRCHHRVATDLPERGRMHLNNHPVVELDRPGVLRPTPTPHHHRPDQIHLVQQRRNIPHAYTGLPTIRPNRHHRCGLVRC